MHRSTVSNSTLRPPSSAGIREVVSEDRSADSLAYARYVFNELKNTNSQLEGHQKERSESSGAANAPKPSKATEALPRRADLLQD